MSALIVTAHYRMNATEKRANATKKWVNNMAFDPHMHHRQSIRLRGYDYSQSGAYFVTICTQNRECLFGDIVDQEMRLNDVGQMIGRWYLALEQKFPDIQCGEFVCMPNHIHFIVVNVGADPRVCPDRVCPDDGDILKGEHRNKTGEHMGSPLRHGDIASTGEHMGSPLPRVVQWFKTMTTNAYIDGVKSHNWPPFFKRLWQRNYYEHIVRNDADLESIQQYIQNNPALWQQDALNPKQEERKEGALCPSN